MTTHDEIAKRLGLRTWAAFRAVIIRDYSECSSQVSTDLCQDIDRLLNEVARLETRLHHDCKGCPGCSSNDCPDALDVALNEVARLEGEAEKMRVACTEHHERVQKGIETMTKAARRVVKWRATSGKADPLTLGECIDRLEQAIREASGDAAGPKSRPITARDIDETAATQGGAP